MRVEMIALIIDNEPDLRELISEFSESFGWETHSDSDEDEAVAVL